MRVRYSKTALLTLEVIIDFLKIRWTDKEIDKLRIDIELFEQTMQNQIITHQSLASHPDIKFALIGNKQVRIYYKKVDNDINIIAFFATKSNPEKIEKLLR